MATNRSDVWIPQIQDPYIVEATTVRSSILMSGAVAPLDALNAEEGGDIVYVPNWKADLSGDAERLTDTTSLTPGKIQADRQQAPVLHRGRAWESRDLAKMAAGSDPLAAIADKIADYTANQQQKDLLAIMSGCFGALGSSNSGAALEGLTIDASGSGETDLSPRQVVKAQALFGQDGGKLAAMIIHPNVYADLQYRGMVDYVSAADAGVTASTIAAGSITGLNAFGGSVAGAFLESAARVPFFSGARVIVSDDVLTSGSGSSTKYATYFFAPGAIGTGQQQAFRSETDRDILAKSSALSIDWHNLYHPLGVRYTGSANPAQSDLSTAGNWTRVFSLKNIGIARATVTSSFD
jgi:hypothetical protein